MRYNDLVKELQKFLGYFLAFWFGFTLVPGLLGSSNDPGTVSLAASGFAILMFVLPELVGFLKLPDHKVPVMFIFNFIFSALYIYILKPGIIGLLYLPKTANLKSLSINMPDLNEFGIILFVSLVAVIIVTVLNLKVKK